jgi:outer membrane protein TolC
LKSAFVPSVSGNIGVGPSYGITTSVPTIFTIHAQSLIINSSQLDYVRGAHAGIEGSKEALQDVREQVEEDTALTYVSLSRAQEGEGAIDQEYQYALRLVAIVQDRLNAGMDTELELKQARRTAVQVRLQRLQLDDEIATFSTHLSQLLGIPPEQLDCMSDSIPSLPSPNSDTQVQTVGYFDTPSVLSAEADAQAKRQQANGDSHYTWRPQIGFAADYGRISPFNGASTYYNLNGNYNTAYAAVQIQLPFLDRTQKARAREALIDAQHAEHTVELLRTQQDQTRLSLQHSIQELSAKAELAELDQSIAYDQLNAILVQLSAGGGREGAPLMTPKDELKSRIQERQDYLELLNDKVQLQEAQIRLLRQTGGLESWIRSAIPTTVNKP